ncbi:UNVERIFIED_CONTAM: hypothetical protein Sindi_3051900 [Sesamum indicum]
MDLASEAQTTHLSIESATLEYDIAGDEDGALADDEGVDGDGFRQETVRLGQVSGEIHELHIEPENPPLMESRIEEIDGDSDTLICWHGDEDGKGIILNGRSVDLGPSSSLSELGFCAAREDETTPVEDETSLTFLGMTNDRLGVFDEGEAMPKDKASNLTENDRDLERRPKLGFGGAPLTTNNGGRREVSFNMSEFIKLAHTVIDADDHASLTALEELKTKWETRFGKEAAAKSFPATTMLTEPPLVRGFRQALRNAFPPILGEKSMGNRDTIRTRILPMNGGADSGSVIVPTRSTEIRPVKSADAIADVGADSAADVGVDYAADVGADCDDDITAELSDDISVAGKKTAILVIVRPTIDTVREGSKRWKATAVGYFMGKWPYYHHLKEFAHSVWPALLEVTATANGFFFFQFKTKIDMEDVIEGGPWLFQGQPIVLQKWKPGMAMRKLKHIQVPVWIKLRHLPMEFWTTEGLSIVASGVGKPLYPDVITRACTRLNFTRVCVMIDVTQKLQNHIIIMTPDEDGGETPCKIDIEYEWLPPKCTGCMTLGHSVKECTSTKPQKQTKPPVKVYVPKTNVLQPPAPKERQKKRETMVEVNDATRGDKSVEHDECEPSYHKEKGKEVIIYNPFDTLNLIDDAEETTRGPNTCSPSSNNPC